MYGGFLMMYDAFFAIVTVGVLVVQFLINVL